MSKTILTTWVRAFEAGDLSYEDLRANLIGFPFVGCGATDGNTYEFDEGGSLVEVGMENPKLYSRLMRDPVFLAPRSATPPAPPAKVAKQYRMLRRGLPPGPASESFPAFATTVTVTKAEDKNLVFGWASVIFKGNQIYDRQGHAIDSDELEEAAYRFAERYRKTGEEHAGSGMGELVESMVFTPEKIAKLGLPADFPVGWWVGFRVPPDLFAKVKSGIYKMFSIQGGAVLEPVLEDRLT